MVHGARARILSLSAALLLATTLVPAGQAASARPATQQLPTSRLDYFAGNKGKLARLLDPAHASYPADVATVQMVNAGLVRLLPNGKVAPDLASWQVSRNHLVYTFTIRQNARFSNGHPVTASDAAFSISRALAPSTLSSAAMVYLRAIKGALQYNRGRAPRVAGLKVLKQRVLQITVTKPIAYFLTMLANPPGDVLDPRVVRGTVASPTSNFLSHHCPANQGAGPFMFRCIGDGFYPGDVPYSPNQPASYALVPNPYYYASKPRVHVQLPASNTIQASYSAYLAGKIDTTPIPTEVIPRWRGRSKQYLEYPTSTVTSLVPDVHTAPMRDLHCRLAMAYGINREGVARHIPGHIVKSTYDYVPPGLPGRRDSRGNPHFDLAKARSELSQCSSRAKSLKLIYFVGSPEGDSAYTSLVRQLRKVGFDASPALLAVEDPKCWCGCTSIPLAGCSFQLMANAPQQDFPDPQNFVTRLLGCGQDYNIGAWCDPTFDRLVNQADVEWNPAKRATLYIQAQHLALSRAARVPLFNIYAHELIKPYVHSLVGSEVSPVLLPKGGDWSRVSVASH